MTTPNTPKQMAALQSAVAAKLAYNAALDALAGELTPFAPFEDRSWEQLIDGVERLASRQPTPMELGQVTDVSLRQLKERCRV